MRRQALFGTLMAFLATVGGCTTADVVFQPRTGVWTYLDGGLTANDCGADNVYRDPDTQFWLTNHLGGVFTIAQAEEGSFDCTIDGDFFLCPRRLSGSNPVQGYDATIHYHVSVSGTLTSETDMNGEQQFDVTCEGADCVLAPLAGLSVPCSYTVAFTAYKQ